MLVPGKNIVFESIQKLIESNQMSNVLKNK